MTTSFKSFARLSRREFVGGLALAGIAGPLLAAKPIKVSALFAGKIDDHGFMQAGYSGLTLAREKLGAEIRYTQGIPPKPDELAAALRALAATKPDLVIAHGGQNNGAAKTVAAEFPETRFVVTQGNVTGPNLSSYEVLQEQSAFLAGVLAALTTKTGTVGHMSGIRVPPGLKGRAAYANGVAFANPKVRLLTNFSGNQDDNALSKRVATAMIEKGADVIFTMLNAGRTGAVDACREKGAHQIGNVVDWTTIAPDVFIGSAFADSGQAVFKAAEDVTNDHFTPGSIQRIGLEVPTAVRLIVAPTVDKTIATKIAALSNDIVAGKLAVPIEWSGPEFENPA